MSERGRLEVSVDGNQSGFQQILNSAKQSARKFADETSHEITSSWGAGIKGMVGGLLGALSFESVKSFVEGMFETSRGIRDAAEQFDLSTDSVQRWEKALDKAGLSSMTFYRALETLRSKRAEARQDPNKRAEFDDMGLGGAAVGTGTSDEELLKQILTSGASRARINDLLGGKGARLKAALPHLGEGQPIYSEEDIERLHEMESKAKRFWAGVKGVVTQSVMGLFIIHKAMQTGKSFRQIATEESAAAQAKKKADEEQARSDALDAEEFANQKELEAADKKDREGRAKNLEAEDRLKDAQRKNMPTDRRRASLKDELSKVEERIKYYEDAAGLLSEADKLKVTDLKIKREGLLGELREKPISLGADSLAKSGLFTASGLNFSMDHSMQKQQLEVLRSIDKKLGGRDPAKL